MQITNTMGLPEPFVNMAKDDYEIREKTYHVTSLLKGTREVLLLRRHDREISRDCADMVWLLLGTAAHGVLERSCETGSQIKESRVEAYFDKYRITGQFDLYDFDSKTVYDYKTCSVWKVIHGEYEEWRRQLLIYAYLLRGIGFPVQRGKIIAILRDHSKRDAKLKADYPKCPVQKIGFAFSDADFAEIEMFIREKLAEIARCETLPDAELPVCTPDQRFNSGDKYAVKKKGRKTAMRVLDSREAAEEWMLAHGGDEIEERRGTDKKCLDYCACNEFCSYYLEHVKGIQE